MGHGEMLMMAVLSVFGGIFWGIGEWLSHRETPAQHLCSDGNVKPGPMTECACRTDWAGLS